MKLCYVTVVMSSSKDVVFKPITKVFCFVYYFPLSCKNARNSFIWETIVSNQVTPRYSSVSFKIFAQKLFQFFREMSLETPYESNYPHNYEYSDESKPEWFFKHSLWQWFVRYVLHSGITLRSYTENWNTTRSTFLPCFLQTKYQGRNTKQTRFSLYTLQKKG